MSRKPKLYGVNCTLIGSFSPTIFHPAWLKSYKLISDAAAESAKVQVVHPSLSVFQVGNLNLHAEEGRLSVATSDQGSIEILRDLVVGILTLLEATPVSKLGINTLAHFEADSEDKWHEFGHTLVPKKPWLGLMDAPGLQSLLVKGKNPHSAKGSLLMKVEPSVRLKFGIFVEVNNHHEFEDASDAKPALEALTSKWDAICRESMEKITKLIDEYLK